MRFAFNFLLGIKFFIKVKSIMPLSLKILLPFFPFILMK